MILRNGLRIEKRNQFDHRVREIENNFELTLNMVENLQSLIVSNMKINVNTNLNYSSTYSCNFWLI